MSSVLKQSPFSVNSSSIQSHKDADWNCAPDHASRFAQFSILRIFDGTAPGGSREDSALAWGSPWYHGKAPTFCSGRNWGPGGAGPVTEAIPERGRGQPPRSFGGKRGRRRLGLTSFLQLLSLSRNTSNQGGVAGEVRISRWSNYRYMKSASNSGKRSGYCRQNWWSIFCPPTVEPWRERRESRRKNTIHNRTAVDFNAVYWAILLDSKKVCDRSKELTLCSRISKENYCEPRNATARRSGRIVAHRSINLEKRKRRHRTNQLQRNSLKKLHHNRSRRKEGISPDGLAEQGKPSCRGKSPLGGAHED